MQKCAHSITDCFNCSQESAVLKTSEGLSVSLLFKVSFLLEPSKWFLNCNGKIIIN